MNISVEKVDDINYIISGTIENALIEEKVAALKAAADALDSEGEEAAGKYEQEAAGQVFHDFIDAGVKEAGIAVETLLGQPGLKRYEKGADTVVFEVDIAVSPVIDTKVDYKSAIPEYTAPEPSAEAIEAKLAEFALKQAPFVTIEAERSVENGDVAVIDFTGYVEGKAYDGGSAEKFKLRIGSGSFIPGFEEQVVGMNSGETRTITVTFPENYQSEELAGKATQFEIVLHEIQEQKPEVPDDAYAKKILGEESATLDTLKEKFADQVRAQEMTDLYNNELKPKLVEGLLKAFSFTLPNNVVEQEIDAKIRERLQHVKPEEQKKLLEDKEQFFALRDAVRPEAQAGIKIAMIVEALAEKEGVQADEQEVTAALTHQAMMSGQDAQQLVQYYKDNNLMPSAILSLTEDKLFGHLLGFDRR